jgi:hypothetical protein
MKILNATKVGMVTCVGVLTDKYPVEHGNCFDLYAEGKFYRIVNFCHENLEEAIKRHKLTWPIKISPLKDDSDIAIIYDERIPDSWYSYRYCEVCCPEQFLPINQQLTHKRQELRGERTYTDVSDGPLKGGRIIGMNMSKAPDFRTQKEKDEQVERMKKWEII